MKLRTAIRYQILDFLKPLAIFYSVIILLMATVTIVFGAVSSQKAIDFPFFKAERNILEGLGIPEPF